ncbi:MAG: peptidoglycan-binding protein [Bryobacteraceae bacterium]|nr:peptidoglycan-binding protein [Bryobacteraceae bacterium]MDW8377881.1 peptidoglycan-binding domain-containing protein [Bryobacterales bacterium]
MKLGIIFLVLLVVLECGWTAAGRPAGQTNPAGSKQTSANTRRLLARPSNNGSARAVTQKAPAPGKKQTARQTAKKTRPARRTTPAATRSYATVQQQPTPERYREIQQALIDRGYLQGEATGHWNQDCTEALRRFQRDQKLEASGKLDSLSLIALGLGPKRTTSAQMRPQ